MKVHIVTSVTLTLSMLILPPVLAELPRFELIDFPDAPVIRPGFQGTIDSAGVQDPEILWDGQLVRLYYTAIDSSGVSRIALATSDDLVSWQPGGIVLEPEHGSFDSHGVSAPDILLIDGQYHLYYTAQNAAWKQIAHTQSPDGLAFTGERSIVLSPSLMNTQFDYTGVSDSSTILNDGLYQMAYRGHDGTPWWRIGLAISTDGIHFNRVIGQTESGSIFGKGPHGFDDGGAEDPEIWLSSDNDVRMLYTSLHY